jgi:tetratricopeptide (TPR) repeat protein
VFIESTVKNPKSDFMKKITTITKELKTKIGLAIVALSIFSGFSVLYVYYKATPERLFTENYHPYERHILRGNVVSSSLKDFYSNGHMDSVILEFKASKSPVPEEFLLAGIAYLEKNQPQKAIETLQLMIQKNRDTKSDMFEDDAEYYLAMAYLNNQEPEKAMPIFEKIEADANHPYNSNVSEWFLLNVRTSIAKK